MRQYYQPYWQTENELEHYGVLGMKWGVRKDPQTAYTKAGNKLKKLNQRAEKTQLKAQKKMEKAWAKNNRAQRAFLFKGIKKWRAAGQTNRTIKAYAKNRNAVSKAMRWQKAMEKAFKDTKINKLDPDTEAIGKKYADKTIESLMSENVSMNALYAMYDRNKTRFNR